MNLLLMIFHKETNLTVGIKAVKQKLSKWEYLNCRSNASMLGQIF